MKTIKSIDGKSLLIGGLLASTIFFAMGATGPKDQWDDKQEWGFKSVDYGTNHEEQLIRAMRVGGLERQEKVRENLDVRGWEPFFIQGQNVIYRKRFK